MYCRNCGAQMSEEDRFCSACGNHVNRDAAESIQADRPQYQPPPYQQTYQPVDPNAKSKMAAGLLGIFLGCFGVHNFYLGYTNKAIAQLLLGTVGCIALGLGPAAAAIWGLIEGIMILTGSINTDADGKPLRD